MPARALVWPGGVRIIPPAPCRAPDRRGGGRRGAVSCFSSASRGRLRRKLLAASGQLKHLIGQRRLLWITLTFPDDYPGTAEAKALFRAWVERLRRRGVFQFIVWRLEYQRRGAPHFHCLLAVPLPLPGSAVGKLAIRLWLSLVPGTVQDAQDYCVVSGFSGLACYVTDMGKTGQARAPEDAPGRWWGVIGRSWLLLEDGTPAAVGTVVLLMRATRRARYRFLGIPLRRLPASSYWTWLVFGLLTEFLDCSSLGT